MVPERPNLFEYATSELSQDAFLCWLLKWADPACRSVSRALHEAGMDLIRILSAEKNLLPQQVNSIRVDKQLGHIDVLCTINEDEDTRAAILIEDKRGTQEHSKQLERYKELLSRGFPEDRIIPVYVQTGDQSDYRIVRSQGYSVVSRPCLLKALEKRVDARRESDILDGFLRHLRAIENDVQSWESKAPEEWSWNAWKGFYMKLQSLPSPSIQGGWNYVPIGDFLCYWFGDWDSSEGIDETWLHINQSKGTLCFRIRISGSVSDTTARYALRDYWHNCITSRCEELGIPARKPERFGRISSVTLTVAEIEHKDWLLVQNGHIDIDATVSKMEACVDVVRYCVKYSLRSTE